MPDAAQETYRRVFQEVIEKMAFMFAESCDDDEFPAHVSDASLVRIKYSGPLSGALMLAASNELSPQFAANVLGLEPDDPGVSVKALDALKELMNVVAGNLVSELAGDEAIVELSIPEAAQIGEAQWNILAKDPASIKLMIDGFPALIAMAN